MSHETQTGSKGIEAAEFEIQRLQESSESLRAELTRLREERGECVDCREFKSNIKGWISKLGGNPDALFISEELDELLAAQDRRIAELEAHRCEVGLENPDAMMAHLAALPAEDLRALNEDVQVRIDRRKNLNATIAAQDAALVALRGRLEMIASDMNCADEAAGIGTCRERFPGKPEAWCPPCVAIDVLTSTAPAAQEAERRVREDERERCKPYMAHDAERCMGSDSECTCGLAAILGTEGEG